MAGAWIGQEAMVRRAAIDKKANPYNLLKTITHIIIIINVYVPIILHTTAGSQLQDIKIKLVM